MPAVSETHLSVYCFPLLGMREPLTPERLTSRQARARLLSRDPQQAGGVTGSKQADRFEEGWVGGGGAWGLLLKEHRVLTSSCETLFCFHFHFK